MQAEDTHLLSLTSGSCKCREIVTKLNIRSPHPRPCIFLTPHLALPDTSFINVSTKVCLCKTNGHKILITSENPSSCDTEHSPLQRKEMATAFAVQGGEPYLKVSLYKQVMKMGTDKGHQPQATRHPHLPSVLLGTTDSSN